MLGQGLFKTNRPPSPACRLSLSPETIAGSTPKKGTPQLPGLTAWTPGNVVIRIEPVSVCHQVSTMGQRAPPIFLWNQRQASGLMGSPTVPSKRKDDRSCLSTHSSPALTKARMAVGE